MRSASLCTVSRSGQRGVGAGSMRSTAPLSSCTRASTRAVVSVTPASSAAPSSSFPAHRDSYFAARRNAGIAARFGWLSFMESGAC